MAALGKQAAARRAQAQSPRQRGLGPTARLGLLINSPTPASDSQVSFNYMAAVTAVILESKKIKSLFPLFPHLHAMK